MTTKINLAQDAIYEAFGQIKNKFGYKLPVDSKNKALIVAMCHYFGNKHPAGTTLENYVPHWAIAQRPNQHLYSPGALKELIDTFGVPKPINGKCLKDGSTYAWHEGTSSLYSISDWEDGFTPFGRTHKAIINEKRFMLEGLVTKEFCPRSYCPEDFPLGIGANTRWWIKDKKPFAITTEPYFLDRDELVQAKEQCAAMGLKLVDRGTSEFNPEQCYWLAIFRDPDLAPAKK